MQLPTIPPPMQVNTGDEDPIHALKDQFFEEVWTFLGYTERSAHIFLRFQGRHVGGMYEQTKLDVSDDHIYTLNRNDVPLASVLVWRDAGNYVWGLFAHYLSDELVERVRYKGDSESSG